MKYAHEVIDLLAADAARPESLLDLSLVPEGDEVSRRIRTSGMNAASALTSIWHPLTLASVRVALRRSGSAVRVLSAAAIHEILPRKGC